MPLRREASHAGSWYESREKVLNKQLTTWLDQVEPSKVPAPPLSVIDVDTKGESSSSAATASSSDSSGSNGHAGVSMPVPSCKAIIAPHAGYSYSGPAAAWAYKCIDPSQFKRVFILGPSHHAYIDGCALSACQTYSTPVGDLPLDAATIRELKATGEFSKDMSIATDEDEHSIEMHLPYIRKVFAKHDITIVPILVGSISTNRERRFGELLAPYLADPETLFVVSSDFCHWGARFSYTYYRASPDDNASDLTSGRKVLADEPRIHSSIRALDGTAIKHLTFPHTLPQPDARHYSSTGAGRLPSAPVSDVGDAAPRTARDAQTQFAAYLRQTHNTICGRHPIGVLLGALAVLEEKGQSSELRFTRYEQSSECMSARDSSVSYASAFVRFVE